MKLSAIHHIAVIGSDYARSRVFYVDTLGFAVLRENYRPDKRDWKIDLKINDDTELELFIPENPPSRLSYPEACGLRHLAFRVESVEEIAAELEALGVPCEPIRLDTFTGKKMTFFHDPDGLPLERHE